KLFAVFHHFPQAFVVLVCGQYEFVKTGFAYSADGIIDDPFQRLFVVVIYRDPEISDQVADLFSLIERKTSVNFIRNIQFSQRLLHGPGLGVGTVQNREVLKTQAMGCLFSQNGSGYGFAFFIIADRADHFDFLARFIFRENNLFELIPVVGDDAVGRVDDVLGGTVILFQFEYFQVGVILLKIQDVLDIRPPEGVNALCIVPHHADVLVNRCQTLDNQVLREIGVLVLVHHNVPEFMLVLMKGLGMVPEQDVGFEQQVVEIHGACLVTAVNISLV